MSHAIYFHFELYGRLSSFTVFDKLKHCNGKSKKSVKFIIDIVLQVREV